MASSFLPSIDLATFASSSQGLDAKALGYIGSVFTEITQSNLDYTFNHLQETIGIYSTYIDVSGITSTDDIVDLLNAGAAKAFVTIGQLNKLRNVKTIEADRLVVLTEKNSKEEVINAISDTAVGLCFNKVADIASAEALLKEYGTDRPDIYVSFAQPNSDMIKEILKVSGIPIVPANLLTIDTKAQPELASVASLLLVNASSDRPDGLYTTLVTDERGIALGLVYSSEESVAESLRTGKGVYQSRKRGLWYKGETSGDVQELVSVSFDCDRDCLLYTVRQRGRGRPDDPQTRDA